MGRVTAPGKGGDKSVAPLTLKDLRLILGNKPGDVDINDLPCFNPHVAVLPSLRQGTPVNFQRLHLIGVTDLLKCCTYRSFPFCWSSCDWELWMVACYCFCC